MSKLTDVAAAIHYLKIALANNDLTLSAIEIEEDIRGVNMLIDSDTDLVMLVRDPLYAQHGCEINGVKIKQKQKA